MTWPWFHKTDLTREELMAYAEQYFYKYQSELTSGAVKGRLGLLNITVSFTVDEENYVK
jgi:hypothetical protein